MPYVDPQTVLVPRNRVRSVRVLYNTGPGSGSWSAALLDFDGEERIAIRWNGQGRKGIGNPQSHGRPTWFVVPNELAQTIREKAEELNATREGGLMAGYREMANDEEREREAQEWSETLIGDATNQER